MFRKVDVAAISFVPVKFDLEGNGNRLEELFRRAAAGGAQLAVAPEGALEGYVVNELVSGEEPPQRMNEVAVTMRGPVIGRFRDLARELGMCLAFGCAEKIGKDVFNCAVFIDGSGRLCGRYHKMQLAEGSHRTWWYNRLGRRSRRSTPLWGAAAFSSATIAGIPTWRASLCWTAPGSCSSLPSGTARRIRTGRCSPAPARTACPWWRPTWG